MPSSNQTKWPKGDSKSEVQERAVLTAPYEAVTRHWSPELCRQVAEYVMHHEEWRPAPAKLVKIALELIRPVSSMNEVFKEIVYMVNKYGTMTVQDPNRPAIRYFSPNAPKMSSPFVDDVVDRMIMNWEQICSDVSTKELMNDVDSAYKLVTAEWDNKIIEQLKLPEDRRDVKYIPKSPYQQFIPPKLEYPNLVEKPMRQIGGEKSTALTITEKLGGFPQVQSAMQVDPNFKIRQEQMRKSQFNVVGADDEAVVVEPDPFDS